MAAVTVGQRWWQVLSRSNPLARKSDRTQVRLVVVLVSLAMLAVPVVAVNGSLWHARLLEVAQHEQASRSSVTAVLLKDATPPDRAAAVFRGQRRQAVVLARWQAPGGAAHTGVLQVNQSAKAGAEVGIWVDQDGNLSTAPLRSEQAAASAVGSAIALWLAFAGILAAIFGLVRARLNQVRSAEWDRDWESIDSRPD